MAAEGTTGPIRRYPRMVAEFTVAYRRREASGTYGSPKVTRTRTVGLGGLMFETDAPFETGEPLQVELVVGDRTVTAEGRVVYVDRDAGTPFPTGVEFTSIRDEDRDFLLGCYLQQEYRLAPD